jgi:hypothetical protein
VSSSAIANKQQLKARLCAHRDDDEEEEDDDGLINKKHVDYLRLLHYTKHLAHLPYSSTNFSHLLLPVKLKEYVFARGKGYKKKTQQERSNMWTTYCFKFHILH